MFHLAMLQMSLVNALFDHRKLHGLCAKQEIGNKIQQREQKDQVECHLLKKFVQKTIGDEKFPVVGHCCR